MATIVESPGITSAKEEAAAILFARQQPAVTLTPKVQPEDNNNVVQSQPKSKYPEFARYHNPEPMPARPQKVNNISLQPYPVYNEVKLVDETQVVRPYIDSSDYLSSAVATTSVTTPTVNSNVENTVEEVTTVRSPLDVELKEDTQYVVKFKNSTIVAATIVASIILLMAVLCVVNIVSLCTVGAEVNALWQESATLEQTLAEEQAKVEEVRQESVNKNRALYHVETVAMKDSAYVVPADYKVESSFFDWLCHSLSHLFS